MRLQKHAGRAPSAACGNKATAESVSVPRVTPIVPTISTRPAAPLGVRMVDGADKEVMTDVGFRHGRGIE
jgi:hypothetical protein